MNASGHRERLRESYLENGILGMADHVVLELLLTYAIPRSDVKPAARECMRAFGSLENVFLASPQELQRIKGIGPSAACFLHLIFEINQRVLLQRFSDKTGGKAILSNPQDACRYALYSSLSDHYETLRLICLDARYRVRHSTVVSVGSLTDVPLDTRRVLESALLSRAHAVILTHNHPSQNALPSPADTETFTQFYAAAEKLGFGVLDQLIISDNCVYSYQNDLVYCFSGPGECKALSPDMYLDLISKKKGYPYEIGVV
ncbi:MAG: hypothetical protein FWE69_06155 [Clostridiales bacterium]|nr:hypothetical protein [Clostridiales bacterium]